MSTSTFVAAAFIFQICLLMAPLVSGLISETDFSSGPGDRICDDDDFNDNSRQDLCEDMMPRGSNVENADATCQNIGVKMLDRSNKPTNYTRYMLVCRNGQAGPKLGCAYAVGSNGNGTSNLSWNGQIFYDKTFRINRYLTLLCPEEIGHGKKFEKFSLDQNYIDS